MCDLNAFIEVDFSVGRFGKSRFTRLFRLFPIVFSKMAIFVLILFFPCDILGTNQFIKFTSNHELPEDIST